MYLLVICVCYVVCGICSECIRLLIFMISVMWLLFRMVVLEILLIWW